MKQKVVVMGIDYVSRLGLVRALGKEGYDVAVLATETGKQNPPDKYTKYASKYRFHTAHDEEELLRILKEELSCPDGKAILIPHTDPAIRLIDTHLEELSHYYLTSNIANRQGEVLRWMDKDCQKRHAEQCGMKVARSVSVAISDGAYEIPEGIIYPCFTKTQAYTVGSKLTLCRCDDEKALRKTLDKIALSHPDLTVMVEEYIDISQEYAVVGVSDGQHVVIPGVIEIGSMGKGIAKGIAANGRILPPHAFQPLIEKFKKYVSSIGFVGMFDIDFYLSGGEYYFCEFNMRVGGSGSAVFQSGVNLPVMLVRMLCHQPIDGMLMEIERPATFINERICSENWRDGYLSTSEFKRIRKAADISFIHDESDPEPERMYNRKLVYFRLVRLVKRILSALGLKKRSG